MRRAYALFYELSKWIWRVSQAQKTQETQQSAMVAEAEARTAQEETRAARRPP